MIDMHGTRLAAVRNRIPMPVWIFVFLTAAVGMMSIGYQAGLSGSRRSLATLAMVVAFSGVIMLIADLDRPQHGFLRVSQQPMIDLQRSMQAEPTGPTAPPAPPALTHPGRRRSNTRLSGPASCADPPASMAR